MQGHDKTACVWGLRYWWDPSLSMNPVRRFAHFMPPCTWDVFAVRFFSNFKPRKWSSGSACWYIIHFQCISSVYFFFIFKLRKWSSGSACWCIIHCSQLPHPNPPPQKNKIKIAHWGKLIKRTKESQHISPKTLYGKLRKYCKNCA